MILVRVQTMATDRNGNDRRAKWRRSTPQEYDNHIPLELSHNELGLTSAGVPPNIILVTNKANNISFVDIFTQFSLNFHNNCLN